MEKTLARSIYKLMEVGKEYTTSDLYRLIGEDYYKYIPEDMQPFQANRVASVSRERKWINRCCELGCNRKRNTRVRSWLFGKIEASR